MNALKQTISITPDEVPALKRLLKLVSRGQHSASLRTDERTLTVTRRDGPRSTTHRIPTRFIDLSVDNDAPLAVVDHGDGTFGLTRHTTGLVSIPGAMVAR